MCANSEDLENMYHDILNDCAKGLHRVRVINSQQLLDFFSKDLTGKTIFCQNHSRIWLENLTEKHEMAKNN